MPARKRLWKMVHLGRFRGWEYSACCWEYSMTSERSNMPSAEAAGGPPPSPRALAKMAIFAIFREIARRVGELMGWGARLG
jgi:hypothetical protein